MWLIRFPIKVIGESSIPGTLAHDLLLCIRLFLFSYVLSMRVSPVVCLGPAKYSCLEVVLDKLCIMLELDSSMVFLYYSYFCFSCSLSPDFPLDYAYRLWSF